MEIYSHLAPQYRAWPSAARVIAVLRVDKFSYIHQQTGVTNNINSFSHTFVKRYITFCDDKTHRTMVIHVCVFGCVYVRVCNGFSPVCRQTITKAVLIYSQFKTWKLKFKTGYSVYTIGVLNSLFSCSISSLMYCIPIRMPSISVCVHSHSNMQTRDNGMPQSISTLLYPLNEERVSMGAYK